MKVWTAEEISRVRSGEGWFYGLVSDTEGVRLREIIPPGYGPVFVRPLLTPRGWWRVARDILFYRPEIT